jgi:diguanylate cyclase (GGDEF)-like protein
VGVLMFSEEMSSNVDIVGEIAGFTSLRDVDLLELSLLKSIYGILNPLQVSLISVDSSNTILKQVDYSASEHGTITTKFPASNELIVAFDKLDNSVLDFCSVNTNNGSTLTLFVLVNNRRVTRYIIIENKGFGISKAHAQQISGMVKIFQNFKQVLQEAQIDELTGLSNRKTFDHIIRKLHESNLSSNPRIENDKRTEKTNQKYWLVLADIDHFKKINDTHGHLMGDEVLVRIAQSFQSAVRTDDFLFRYGGEEFALIISANDESELNLILERVRTTISSIAIPNIGNITVSMGCIELIESRFYLESLEYADQALYKSKENGRDQVTHFDLNSISNDVEEEMDIDLF